MILTVFRNRLRPEAQAEYSSTAQRMSALADTMPGHVSHKTFVAEDGERVTLVEFATEEDQRRWATHAEHMQAQAQGRNAFYAEFSLQVCSVLRETRFHRDPGGRDDA